jgi:hypothetical protein
MAARPIQPAEADAAIGFRHIDGGKAKLGGGLDGRLGVDVLFIPFGGMGRDAVRREAARGFLDGALVVGQVELHWLFQLWMCRP